MRLSAVLQWLDWEGEDLYHHPKTCQAIQDADASMAGLQGAWATMWRGLVWPYSCELPLVRAIRLFPPQATDIQEASSRLRTIICDN
jgi:hypothetical protein